VSAAWGGALTAEAIARRLQRIAPLFATASLAFGVWYGLAALA
jgi:hypothetical protein